MSEMTIELTDAIFDQSVIESREAFLVDFWAPWCQPCLRLGPTIDDLATEYAGKMKVGKVNVDENQQIAMRYGISSIPTLLLFKDGEMKERIMGAVPKAALKQVIDKQLG